MLPVQILVHVWIANFTLAASFVYEIVREIDRDISKTEIENVLYIVPVALEWSKRQKLCRTINCGVEYLM